MQDLLDSIVQALEKGQTGALVTVLESRGSAPRGPGAVMFVLPDGKQLGTVGGGVLEHAAAVRALELLGERGTEIKTFALNNTDAGALGMVCGGEVTVLMETCAPGTALAAIVRELNERIKLGESVHLVREMEGESVKGLSVKAGSIPRAALVRDGEKATFSTNFGPEGRAVVFGGGHVSAALVPLLQVVGFRVAVCEDRAAFAGKERFPDAEAILIGDYGQAFDKLYVRASDALIVMTRGHEADLTVLARALKTNAAYIGCIGSRHKIAFTREKLIGMGYTDADLARIHTPIGLDIGAETPEEIAVSIAAELIAFKRGAMV